MMLFGKKLNVAASSMQQQDIKHMISPVGGR